MKKLLTVLALLSFSLTLVAQTTWEVDKAHAKITFGVEHLGISEVDGMFNSFDVKITSNKEDFSDAVFQMTIDVNSINTAIEMRDNHLRSADFFDVAKYPQMIFKSTGITKISDNKYKLTGELTMHGISKPVTMDLWYRGVFTNPSNNSTSAGFQLTGTIDRRVFDVGPGFPPPMIGNEVRIKADGEFIKK